MSSNWIDALAQQQAVGSPSVLVTVIDQRGSAPRSAGAKMLVTPDDQFDSIGGGHLEYKAVEIARQLLQDGARQPQLERFSLGASLGQCCGGAVTLLFEPLGGSDVQIALFGAGHVGRALIPILASLPCRVHWVDSRAEAFPDRLPERVEKVVSEFPADEVASLPPGSYFVVMTHSHSLDQELIEQILKRGDFQYCGLIGSRSKHRKFAHRLQAKGFTEEQIARITCPIGLAQIQGKLPAEIAVSIAAEIIAHYHADGSSQEASTQDASTHASTQEGAGGNRQDHE